MIFLSYQERNIIIYNDIEKSKIDYISSICSNIPKEVSEYISKLETIICKHNSQHNLNRIICYNCGKSFDKNYYINNHICKFYN